MDEQLHPESDNPLLGLRLQRPYLRKTTSQKLGYLGLSQEAILQDLIARSEIGTDPVLKAEAYQALLRYVKAITPLQSSPLGLLPANSLPPKDVNISQLAILSLRGLVDLLRR